MSTYLCCNGTYMYARLSYGCYGAYLSRLLLTPALLSPQTTNISPSMSQVSSVATSSTNFEAIFTAAFEEYKKQTKKDIASHPLAAGLQSCDSPSAILAVLQAQVQAFDQSQSTNEKLTAWLYPTVNVLYAFSGTLNSTLGLVTCERSTPSIYTPLMYVTTDISTFERDFCWDWCPSPSEHLS
jgi:hypothetical protein